MIKFHLVKFIFIYVNVFLVLVTKIIAAIAGLNNRQNNVCISLSLMKKIWQNQRDNKVPGEQ